MDGSARAQDEQPPVVVAVARLAHERGAAVELGVHAERVAAPQRVGEALRPRPQDRVRVAHAGRQPQHGADGRAPPVLALEPPLHHARGDLRGDRRAVVAEPGRHLRRRAHQLLAPELVRHRVGAQGEQREQLRAQRRVVGRQLVERLLEQRDRVVVDLAVGLEVGEAERGGGEGGGVAAAAGERGGLAVAPARLLDVPVGQARAPRARRSRRRAPARSGAAPELARLERVLVEAPRLRVGEHRPPPRARRRARPPTPSPPRSRRGRRAGSGARRRRP